MQIDNQNFQENIEIIIKHIENAHFIAFDCQFTGLVTQTYNIQGLFSSQQEFYQRIKETALNFNLLQLGITIFHYQNQQYYPRSYNFYVSTSEKQNYNKIFVSQWESLAFLAHNGMNFHRAFKCGINYNRIYEKSQKSYENNKRNYMHQSKTFFNKNDKQIIDKIQKQIIEKQLRIDFKSKLILDYFRQKYDISFDKPKKDMQKYQYFIKIYTPMKKEQQENNIDYQNIDKDKKQEIQQGKKYGQKVGLQIIIKKIIQCKKPLVGHFPNLDIGLIYQSFIQQLPQTYKQFSDRINELFPYIFDTKVISVRLQNKIKSIKVDLKSLYRACFNTKTLGNHANINYKYVQDYIKQDSSHQAGYDSFMTGCAFIAMLNYIYDLKKQIFGFNKAETENKILFSKFSGEISLIGPIYSQRGQQFKRKIVVYQMNNKEKQEYLIAEKLSNIGTLTMNEDHGQIYYYFEQNQDIQNILCEYKNLKHYKDRFIMKSRKMYK